MYRLQVSTSGSQSVDYSRCLLMLCSIPTLLALELKAAFLAARASASERRGGGGGGGGLSVVVGLAPPGRVFIALLI